MVEALRPASPAHPLHAIEAGAGIGTMVERLLDRGVLTDTVYDAVDLNPRAVAAARERWASWAARHGWKASPTPDGVSLTGSYRQIELRCYAQDAVEHAQSMASGEADLLVAHAFLDLIDWPRSLPTLFRWLRPDGIFYFTINFDGETAFWPAPDPGLDRRVIEAYHRTMDDRHHRWGIAEGRFTGRHLLEHLPKMGVEIIDAGPSDWLVRPIDGAYPADEAYFLRYLIETVRRAVRESTSVSAGEVDGWASGRHTQVDRGELWFMAHQWDVVGRRTPPPQRGGAASAAPR
jgi:SAM-dependent methyltransferase